MPYYADGTGKPMDNAEGKVWYHGSPLLLDVLAKGSSITRNRDVAIAFSHRPTKLCVSDDGEISHNGEKNGYLYEIAEPVSLEDIYVHPALLESAAPDDHWEWLTKKPFQLKLIQETIA